MTTDYLIVIDFLVHSCVPFYLCLYFTFPQIMTIFDNCILIFLNCHFWLGKTKILCAWILINFCLGDVIFWSLPYSHKYIISYYSIILLWLYQWQKINFSGKGTVPACTPNIWTDGILLDSLLHSIYNVSPCVRTWHFCMHGLFFSCCCQSVHNVVWLQITLLLSRNFIPMKLF